MWGSLESPDRGQSEVLGVALLFGTVLTLSVAVVMGGATVLEQSHAQTSMQSAQVSMSELDQEIEASGSAGGGAAPPPGGESSFDGFSGEGEVEVRDSGQLNLAVTQDGSTETANVSLGAVVYERDGSEIAYQGGGIWRSAADSDESVMVSPPSMDYRAGGKDPTLTLPIVNVTGSASGSDFDLRRNGTEDVFPSSSAPDPTLTGEDDELVVRVQSAYYQAWGEAFEDQVSGGVEYDHEKQMVIVRLSGEGESGSLPPFGGIEATGFSGSPVSANNNVEVSSYDSEDGDDPTAVEKDNTRVAIRGSYKHNNNAKIRGNLIVENKLTFPGGSGTSAMVENETVVGGPSEVRDDGVTFAGNFSTEGDLNVEGSPSDPVVFEEDVYVGGDVDDKPSPNPRRFRYVVIRGDLHVQQDVDLSGSGVIVDGDVYVTPGATVEGGSSYDINRGSPVEPLNAAEYLSDHSLDPNVITSKSSYPDTDPEIPHIENDENDTCTPCSLSHGNYSLNEINLQDDEELTLDTSSGPINISVTDQIYLKDSHITVAGSDSVTIYNNGDLRLIQDGSSASEIATVQTDPIDRHAPNVMVYQHHGKTVNINGGSKFTGVIYGPGPSGNNAVELVLDNDATIFGSVVGDPRAGYGGIAEDANIYYDEALNEMHDGMDGGPVSRDVRFVQVDSEKVVVED